MIHNSATFVDRKYNEARWPHNANVLKYQNRLMFENATFCNEKCKLYICHLQRCHQMRYQKKND